jgi:hypothetical protein
MKYSDIIGPATIVQYLNACKFEYFSKNPPQLSEDIIKIEDFIEFTEKYILSSNLIIGKKYVPVMVDYMPYNDITMVATTSIPVTLIKHSNTKFVFSGGFDLIFPFTPEPDDYGSGLKMTFIFESVSEFDTFMIDLKLNTTNRLEVYNRC